MEQLKESTSHVRQENKISPLQQIQQFLQSNEYSGQKPLSAEALNAPRCDLNHDQLKPKNKIDFKIFPLQLIEQFYKNKILPSASNIEKNDWSARFIITTAGELRLEQESTSINSSSIARHMDMPADGPEDITLASEASKGKLVQPMAVLAAGKLYFEPGQKNPTIIGIDANSGYYRAEFGGSTAYAIATLLFCEKHLSSPLLADNILLHDLYGTNTKQVVSKETLQTLFNSSKTMQAVKADLVAKNVGEKARREPIMIKKEPLKKKILPERMKKLVLSDETASNMPQRLLEPTSFQASISDLHKTLASVNRSSNARQQNYADFLSIPLEESRTSSSDSEMEAVSTDETAGSTTEDIKSGRNSYNSALRSLGVATSGKRKAEKSELEGSESEKSSENHSTPKKHCGSGGHAVFISPLRTGRPSLSAIGTFEDDGSEKESEKEKEPMTPISYFFNGPYSGTPVGTIPGFLSDDTEEDVLAPKGLGLEWENK